MRRLVCLLRGHRRVRIIMRLGPISADPLGGIRATVTNSRFACMRCGRDL